MGLPKALLPALETTLSELVVANLSPGFDELIVAARDQAQVPPALRAHLVIDGGGAGPLAGIAAGLAASRHATLFAVACDMPWLSLDLALMMVEAAARFDAAVPRVAGRPEPVAAAYRKSALPPIEAAIAGGRLKTAKVLEDLNVTYLELPAAPFRSINTPAEYSSLLVELGGPKPS
jgi:molybdopterin-guanine dinucleotide biosynthesis protein A